jgi:hypothetical protein
MTDKYGLPVTASGDAGDSACICGTLMTVDDNYKTPNNLHMYVNDETPVRHPDTDKWYGRPWRFSRDQLIGLLCGLIARRNRDADVLLVGHSLFQKHLLRGFLFAWNRIRNFQYETVGEHLIKSTPDVKWNSKPKMSDITGPEVWGLWIRFWNWWPLYPLLLIFDLETLVGAILWRWKPKNDITRNHMLIMITQKNCMPTPASWLALKLTNKNDLCERWHRYCVAVGEIDTSKLFLEKLK